MQVQLRIDAPMYADISFPCHNTRTSGIPSLPTARYPITAEGIRSERPVEESELDDAPDGEDEYEYCDSDPLEDEEDDVLDGESLRAAPLLLFWGVVGVDCSVLSPSAAARGVVVLDVDRLMLLLFSGGGGVSAQSSVSLSLGDEGPFLLPLDKVFYSISAPWSQHCTLNCLTYLQLLTHCLAINI